MSTLPASFTSLGPLRTPTILFMFIARSKALSATSHNTKQLQENSNKTVVPGLSARTADYDLNDMTRKGILRSEKAGSNTRYQFGPGARWKR